MNILKCNILPAVRISSGCVTKSKESVVNERQEQASLATVKKNTLCHKMDGQNVDFLFK